MQHHQLSLKGNWREVTNSIERRVTRAREDNKAKGVEVRVSRRRLALLLWTLGRHRHRIWHRLRVKLGWQAKVAV